MLRRLLLMLTLLATAAVVWQGRNATQESPEPAAASAILDAVAQKSSARAKPMERAYLASRPMPSVSTRRLGAKAFELDGSLEPPAGKAVDAIRTLASKAESGDNRASLQLFVKLTNCLHIDRERHDDDALLMDSQIMGGIDAAIRRRAERQSECEGLSPQNYADRSKWLEQAASRGDVLAQLMYAADPEAILGTPTDMLRQPEKVAEYKARALGYLTQAAATAMRVRCKHPGPMARRWIF